VTGHEDALMNEYLRAISSVFLTATTNDEVMIFTSPTGNNKRGIVSPTVSLLATD